MEQFLAVAAAHFVALLIPGVDFFLIVRTAMAGGWRTATGVCIGIALANAVFVVSAFSGIALISHPAILGTIQAAGGVFLTYLGIVFLRTDSEVVLSTGGDVRLAAVGRGHPVSRAGYAALGFASGLLNPKNALFYLSLAAALSGGGSHVLAFYGAWMVTVVLLWDLFIARAFGSEAALARFGRLLPRFTRIAGIVLLLFGLGMIVGLLNR